MDGKRGDSDGITRYIDDPARKPVRGRGTGPSEPPPITPVAVHDLCSTSVDDGSSYHEVGGCGAGYLKSPARAPSFTARIIITRKRS